MQFGRVESVKIGGVKGTKYTKGTMKEKKDWNESIFSKKIRVAEDDLQWIKETKGKRSGAGRLRDIIRFAKKYEKEKSAG